LLHKNSVGESRAKVVTDLLKELNEFVSGHYVEEDPVHLIDHNPNFVKDFSLVVTGTLPEKQLLVLAHVCWENNIPLVVSRAYGLLGYLRIAVPEHKIIEPKYDPAVEDLRLANPWAELEEFSHSIKFEEIKDEYFGHVPFPVIILQKLAEWKSKNNGKAPSTSAERNILKAEILKLKRKADLTENLDEATKILFKAVKVQEIPQDTLAILNDPKTANLTDKTHNFWILAAAVNEFLHNEGAGTLPAQGTVPDMAADTDTFLKLQKIYQNKSAKDLAVVTHRVNSITNHLGRPAIPEEEIKIFCRNTYFLKVLRYKSLEEEYNSTVQKAHLASLVSNPDINSVFYVLIRAVDRFYTAHHRFPGTFDDEVESDIPLLKSTVGAFLNEIGVDTDKVSNDHIHEMCRFGASETHGVAGFMGGVTAQEILKLVTEKWVPLDNTYIFNGLNCTTNTITI